MGTGIGAPPGYREAALQFLAAESGLAVRAADDLFDALANLDEYVNVAAQLVRVSVVMAKIASDLRLLSSGPVGGIGEVELRAVQVGSSIIPGKFNPVIPELVMQVSYETRGAAIVVEAAAAVGELELKVMEPVIARHLLGSIQDVGRTARGALHPGASLGRRDRCGAPGGIAGRRRGARRSGRLLTRAERRIRSGAPIQQRAACEPDRV